jgi:hypothetical protein
MSYLRPQHRLLQRDFSEGFLDTPESDTLDPGASPDAKNCLLVSVENQTKRRAVIRRDAGALLLNPTAIAAQKSVDGLFEFLRENANGQLVAACNGALYAFDNVNTFAAITGGTGFTPGSPVRMSVFRNNAVFVDGNQNLRYNGTQCFPLGFAAPTGAPGLADGGAGGSLPAATWEGFAVWYDSVMDHESDWSPISSQLVLGGSRLRQWTKPAGSPPTNVDKWRVYCRRVDTNERNYFLVGTVAIGTVTLLESVSDLARVIPSANVNENLPPSQAFAMIEEWLGFALGVPSASSMLNVSKQFDAESWNPKNQFPVGGKGDSKPVRSIRKYGEEVILQKPRKSYRVLAPNGTLPFQIKPIHSSLGNVSQESALEVRGWLYGWDEIVGPYRTNLVDWHPLGDNRIANAVRSVNRLALDQIRAEHDSTNTLIVFSVPTTSPRKRTLLRYNYVLDRWMPPRTGMEYCSLSLFTTTAGNAGLYFGDYWGRVYQMYGQENDGVPAGSMIARVSSATSSTITCDFEQMVNADGSVTTSATAVSFYTTGNGLAGMPYALRNASGDWTWGIIASNSGTQITVDTVNGALVSPLPDATYTLVVGGIEGYWWTPQIDFDDPEMKKIARWFSLQGRVPSSQFAVNVAVRLDQHLVINQSFPVQYSTTGLVWGVGVWGDLWGGDPPEAMKKHRINRRFAYAQFRFSNYMPNQPWTVTAYGFGADPLVGQRAASA